MLNDQFDGELVSIIEGKIDQPTLEATTFREKGYEQMYKSPALVNILSIRDQLRNLEPIFQSHVAPGLNRSFEENVDKLRRKQLMPIQSIEALINGRIKHTVLINSVGGEVSTIQTVKSAMRSITENNGLTSLIAPRDLLSAGTFLIPEAMERLGSNRSRVLWHLSVAGCLSRKEWLENALSIYSPAKAAKQRKYWLKNPAKLKEEMDIDRARALQEYQDLIEETCSILTPEQAEKLRSLAERKWMQNKGDMKLLMRAESACELGIFQQLGNLGCLARHFQMQHSIYNQDVVNFFVNNLR